MCVCVCVRNYVCKNERACMCVAMFAILHVAMCACTLITRYCNLMCHFLIS